MSWCSIRRTWRDAPCAPGPALRLLDGYLHSLAAVDGPPPPGLAPVIGGHLLDLVAAVLGPSRDAAETIERRGAKAARLRAILAEISRRFSDPGFNIDSSPASSAFRGNTSRICSRRRESRSPSTFSNAGSSAPSRC
jgi:hypothetical protein